MASDSDTTLTGQRQAGPQTDDAAASPATLTVPPVLSDYDEKPRYSCSGSGRIEKKFHLRHLADLTLFNADGQE